MRRGAGWQPDDTTPTAQVDVARLLARVRQGARRRRLRHGVAGIVGLVAVMVVVTVAVPTLVAREATPVADGAPITQARAFDVAATGDTVWVAVRGRCGGDTCRALARSSDGGASWAFEVTEVNADDPAALPASARRLAMAPNATDRWAWTRDAIAATHDGGHSWTAIDLPTSDPLRGVSAGAAEVIAVTARTVAVTQVGTDTWRQVDVPLKGTEALSASFAGADTLGAVVHAGGTPTGLLVGSRDGFERVDLPCPWTAGAVRAGTNGDLLWVACLGADRTVLASSPDGTRWSTAELPGIASRAVLVVRPDDVILAGAGSSFRVVATQLSPDGEPAAEPPHSEPLPTGAGGFRDGASGRAAWLAGNEGQLLARTSTGWERVPID